MTMEHEIASVVAAMVRLANDWRRHGGPDQAFEDFIREAASVSEAPDAMLVLPCLGPGTPAPGSIAYFADAGGRKLGGTVLRAGDGGVVLGMSDGSEHAVPLESILWVEPPAEG